MIKLPSTARKRGEGHIRVIESVALYADVPRLEGRILRPGASVPRATLPNPCVLVECAGPDGPGNVRPRPYLWILWKLDEERQDWREIARAAAPDRSWLEVIAPAAARALEMPELSYPCEIDEIAGRVVKSLDWELARLPLKWRPILMARLETQVNARIAANCDLGLTRSERLSAAATGGVV